MTRLFTQGLDGIEQKLVAYSSDVVALPGAGTKFRRRSLGLQIISSLRRIKFVVDLDKRPISPDRANPLSNLFDPLRAAIRFRNAGNIDEAAWIVLLATHFGKHSEDGWRLMRDIYGAFGQLPPWTWKRMTSDKGAFAEWAKADLKGLLSDGVSRRFSNHRKYESRKPEAIAEVLNAYVQLVQSFGGHQAWLIAAHKARGQNPTEAFDFLYESLDGAKRFGRLGKFDFLTMLGKLQLMPIEPGIAYLSGSTGPLRGARLLFDGDTDGPSSASLLESKLVNLGAYFGLGMQTLEDSLCNWQKSPDSYVYFKG